MTRIDFHVEQVSAFLSPAPLEHQRQAVDDDVEKAADAQPKESERKGRKQDARDGRVHRLRT